MKAESVYAALLHAYPKEFRARFGAEMQQTFRDRWRALSAAPGWAPRIRFFAEIARDWIMSSSRERMAVMRTMFSRRGLWRAARGLGVASATLLVLLLIGSTFLRAYVIPSWSMEGSIDAGDHILASKVGPASPIEHGDLITFRYPENPRMVFLKRVIGLPGDHLRLLDKQVIRNGRPLDEPYAEHKIQTTDDYRDNFPAASPAKVTLLGLTPLGLDMLRSHIVDGEVVVPAAALFVLGDNRDNSLDSRYWGFVPRENVIGKPLLVYWSYDVTRDQTPMGAIPQHFFTQTRWNRMLHLLGAPPRVEER